MQVLPDNDQIFRIEENEKLKDILVAKEMIKQEKP